VPVLGERNPSDDDASVEVGICALSFKVSPFSLGDALNRRRPALGEEARLNPRALRLGGTPDRSEGRDKLIMRLPSCLGAKQVSGSHSAQVNP
jgi:hypothetical protein